MTRSWLSASWVPYPRGGARRSEFRVAPSLLGILTAACLSAVALAPAAWAQPDAYSGAEIRATVVDADTRQPLEGVFIVARWELDQILSREKKPLHVMETVTDTKGEFYFPPWGPKPRPAFTRLWGGDPRLLFFKPGYEPLTRGNPFAPDDSPVRVSHLHGKTIEVTRFRGTPEQWTSLLSVFQTILQWGAGSHDFPYGVNDHWKYYPRTVLAILEERRRIPESIRHYMRDLADWEVTEDQVRAAAQRKGVTP
jgi:hypothetical protein